MSLHSNLLFLLNWYTWKDGFLAATRISLIRHRFILKHDQYGYLIILLNSNMPKWDWKAFLLVYISMKYFLKYQQYKVGISVNCFFPFISIVTQLKVLIKYNVLKNWYVMISATKYTLNCSTKMPDLTTLCNYGNTWLDQDQLSIHK